MTSRVRVTDHALVRWLERTGALEVEALREALAASLERCGAAAQSLGVDNYLIVADGLTYIVRSGNLVTVVDSGDANDNARRMRPGR